MHDAIDERYWIPDTIEPNAPFIAFVTIYRKSLYIKQMKVTTADVLGKIDSQTRDIFENFIGRSTPTLSFMQFDDFLEKESIVCRSHQQPEPSSKRGPKLS